MDIDAFNLNLRDSARVASTLSEQENLVLVIKPREQMDPIMKFLRLSAGVALMAWLLWKGAEMQGGWPVQLLLWGMVILLFCSPWLHLWKKRNTLYMLTTERAIVVEPSYLGQDNVQTWSLQPNPIQKVNRYSDGFGDIVLGYEMRWSFGRIFQSRGGGLAGDLFRRRRVSVGFLEIPRIDEVYSQFAALTNQGNVDELPTELTGSTYTPPNAPVCPRPAYRKPNEFGEWSNNSPDTTLPQALVGFGTVLSIFSCIAIAVGAIILHFEQDFDANCVKTQATVVNVRYETKTKTTKTRRRGTGVNISLSGGETNNTTITYFPTLSFSDASGRLHVHESDDGTSDPKTYHIGQQLTIRYLPNEPTEVKMGEESTLGVKVTTYGALALFISGSMLILGLVKKRKGSA